MDEERIQRLIDQMEKFVEGFGDQIELTGDATNSTRKAMSAAEKELKKLNDLYKSAAKQIKELDDAIKDGSANAEDMAGSFNNINRQLIRSGKAIDDETAARIKSTRQQILVAGAQRSAVDATQAITTAFIDLKIKGIKTVISSLQDSGNAFELYTKLQNQQIEFQSQSVQAAGKGLTDLGTIAALVLPPQLKILGVGAVALGELLGFTAKKGEELAKFRNEVLLKEVTKITQSFGEATKAGMFFSGGMTEMADIGNDAGVSYKEFIGALKDSSKDLALLGGNAGAGAIQVGKTFRAMDRFTREGLYKLGLSTTEQIQAVAEYTEMQRRGGTIAGKSFEQLAKETGDYVANLKVVSSITGEDAKAAQKRARDEAQQTATQTRLRNEAAKGNVDATKKFEQGVRIFGPELSGTLGQIIEFGEVTDMAKRTALEQNPVFYKLLKDYAQDITTAGVSQEKALENFMSKAKAAGPAMEAQAKQFGQTVGRANRATGAFADQQGVGQSAMRLAMQAQTDGFETAKQQVDDQMNTTDVLTKNVAAASREFSELQAGLEKKLRPALEDFSNFVRDMLHDLDEMLFKLLGIKSADRIAAEQAAAAEAKRVATQTREQATQRADTTTEAGAQAAERRKALEASGAAPADIAKAKEEEDRLAAQTAQRSREQMEAYYREREARRQQRKQQGAAKFGKPITEPPTNLPPAPGAPGTPLPAPQPPAGPQEDPLSKLNFKNREENTGGGKVDPRLMSLAEKIQTLYPSATFTAMNDVWHQKNAPNSKHTQGTALDFSVFPAPRDASEAAQIKQTVAALGFSKVLDEYFADRGPKTTGGHIHAELQDGGLTTGPSIAGESGTEAVIPLRNGSVPVNLDLSPMLSALREQTDLNRELLEEMRDTKNIQERLLNNSY